MLLVLGLLIFFINLFPAVADYLPAKADREEINIVRFEEAGSSLSPQAGYLFFHPISINQADENLFAAIPGIGLDISRRIIALRTRKTSFTRLEELLEVKGIGPKKFANMKKFCCL